MAVSIAGVAGHDDDFGVGRDLLDLLEHLDAGQAGHAQIENGGVEDAVFERLDRGLAVGADGDLMAEPGHLGSHDFLQRPFIVREQDA